jgi:N-acetylmuramoyl-L-alanine amidase
MLRFDLKKIVSMIVVVGLVAAGGITVAAEDIVPAEKDAIPSIVIDPGHGGHDKGAFGPGGTSEKEVTLTLALMTASALKSRYEVLVTRTGDYQVEAPDRIVMANNSRADLFISLHVGGSFSMQHSGVTIFFLHADFEQVQNTLDSSVADNPDTRTCVPWDEAHYSHYRVSRSFANVMEQSCKNVFGDDCRVKSDRVAVLQGVNMPAVMLEIGCLNNPVWEEQFRSSDRLTAISRMICQAVDQYFEFDGQVDEGISY